VQGTLTVVLQLLLVAGAVGLLAKRLQVHYNIALVLAGVVVGSLHWLPPTHLDPEVVIHVFLPILLFEAAISTDLRRLRENRIPILLLAVPGILVSVAVIGLVVREGLGLAWPLALLLGSILAATDTIAVIATVRKVRAPSRLTTILENDSLFNDGTALVAFSTILAFLGPGRVVPTKPGVELVWVVGAGLLVGVALGFLASQLARRTEDHLFEIMVTVILTYGAWVLAGRIGASPVLAVVAAGITFGTEGWPGLTPTGRVAIRSAWEVASFGVNSLIFLLIGLQVDFPALIAAAPAVGWGLVALTLGRAASVYLLLAPLSFGMQRVPLSWQHVLVWGNLKGSLSMALALSLPADLPRRELITTIVFGCALVTLTVQGLSLAPVARALGLGRAGEAERRWHLQQARLLAARAGQTELDRLQHLGLVPLGVFQRLRASYQGVIARSEKQLRDLVAVNADEEVRQTQAVRRQLLAIEKEALRRAVNSGMLGEEVSAELAGEIDRALSDLTDAKGG
jgi:monovalent cation:H+ antiporter, CPA1 family